MVTETSIRNVIPYWWRFGFMTEELELFVWYKPDGGFEWRDGVLLMPDNQRGITEIDRRETRFLRAKPMETPRHLRYHPLREFPTLYREFANLEPTEEAYAQFASNYGDLGLGLFLQETGINASHDPFCRWRTAHARIRSVSDVLIAIQDEDIQTLKQWFSIVGNGALYEREHPVTWRSQGWVTMDGEIRDYLWKWAIKADSDAEALLRIARGWAQGEINGAISDVKQPGANSSARVVLDQDRGRMTLRIVPETLIGAMWFQCARVLTQNPTFRACKHCEKWFELSPDKRRKQAIYCSPRCKVAAYRAKKSKLEAVLISNSG